MVRSLPDATYRPAIRPWLWLAAAVIVLCVANGRWIWPAAAWIGPWLMLRYVDSSPPRRGLVLGLAGSFLAWSIAWQGMIPAPGWRYFMVTAIYAVVYFLPYAAHRLLAHRLAGLPATLVFPTSWVGVDLVFQRFISPYGSWTSLAYTQMDFLPLVQLASVTGSFGITFLITWTAAVLAAWWRTGPAPGPLRGAVIWCGISLVAAVAFGTWRLAGEPPGATMTVAAVMPSDALRSEFAAAFGTALVTDPPDAAAMAAVTSAAERLNADLEERTRRSADHGADVIAWSENAARVLQQYELNLIRRAQDMADTTGAVLTPAYGGWQPGADPPMSNNLAILQPGAGSAVAYRKARPIIGAESPFIGEGSPTVAVLDTPGLVVGAAICHDMDFPDLIRDAGRADVSLMVAPSDDWPRIARMHAGMATLRAIENGFALLRPTSGGISVAADAFGRTSQWTDRDGVLVTDLQVASVPTLYRSLGDLFAWLCLAGMLLLCWRSWLG